MNELKEKISEAWESLSSSLREKLLGENNERLDFLMDTFNKLNPNHQAAVMSLGAGLVLSVVVFAFYVYQARMSVMQERLNERFAANTELAQLNADDQVEQARFDKLVQTVQKKTRRLDFKPFFERLSRASKLSINSINEKKANVVDSTNPLVKAMDIVHLEMRIAKVSIPKLLNFLVDIEKSGHYLRVQNLKITGIYGNKLYFDVDLLVRGYQVASR